MTSLDHDNNLCLVTLPSPSSSAEPAELHSKLEALKKVNELCEFLTNLNKHPNEPKNLLENLCDGLEKFLGFNPTSKGYTGKGIVYSDLDRLCDGVMGFLSGVLSNIQGHLGQHKNALNDAIEALKTNKHSGKNGFNVAIEKVVAGVGRYNDAVRDSNKKVSDVITKMQREMNKYTGNALQPLLKEKDYEKSAEVKKAVEQIDRELEDCKNAAKEFNDAFDLKNKETMKKDVEDLNAPLTAKVKSVAESVKHESERLSRMAERQKKDYDEIIALIKEKLVCVKNDVKAKINEKIIDMASEMKRKVSDILKQLKELEGKLKWYAGKLADWIKDADNIVKEAMKEAGNIEIGIPGGDKESEIRNQADDLRQKGETLFWKFSEAKYNVENNVKTALERVKSMDEALKGDLFKVKDAVNKQVGEIKEAIGALYGVVDTKNNVHSKELRNKIETVLGYIHGKVTEIKTHVGERMRHGSVPNKSIQQSWDKLKQDVTDYVRMIKGEPGKSAVLNNKGLTQIRQGVKAYAKNFGKGQFLNILNWWAGKLVDESSGEVNRNITYYVTTNTQNLSGQFNPQYESKTGAEAVKAALKNGIPDFIQQAVKAASDTAGLEDEVDVSNIVDKFRVFTEQIDIKIKATDVGSAVRAMEMKMMLNTLPSNRDYKQHFLQLAISNIFSSVASSAKHFATELHGFMVNSKIENVETAMKNVDLIANQVDNEKLPQYNGGYGFNIDQSLSAVQPIIEGLEHQLNTATQAGSDGDATNTSAAAVDTAIEQVTKTLDANLPPESGGKKPSHVKLEQGTFTEYENFVAQPIKGTELTGIAGEGTLPAAIGAIRDTAKSDFENAKSIIHDVTSFNTLSEAIKKHLSDLSRAYQNAGKSIHDRLNTLSKTKIGMKPKDVKAAEHTLQGIQQQFDGLRNFDLKSTISAVTKFPGEAEILRDQCVRHLQSHAEEQVDSAITALEHKVNKQYFLATVQLLSEFSNRVEKELKPLPQEIKNDLEKGHKRFMNVFAAKFVNNVEKIKPITATSFTQKGSLKISPVSQAAKELNKSLTYCFQSLNRQADITADVDLAEPAKKAVLAVLGSIQTSNHFDHTFVDNLVSLKNTMHEFNPITYGEGNNPWLLDSLKKGLSFLTEELQKAYVSVYDGGQGISKWLTKSDTTLTDEGRNGAKVCLTIIHLLGVSLPMLRVNCKSLSGQQINKNGDLGKLFADEGYRVSDRGEQNGELQDKDYMKGDQVQKRLTWPISGVDERHLQSCKPNEHKKVSLIDIMSCLVSHLGQYNDVCHIAPSPKGNAPCNVYQMLCWLDGLPHSPVYQDLIIDGFSALFEKPGEQHKDVQSDDLPVIDENADTLDAYPRPITAAALRETLREVCKQAHNVLTAILGYGHADGVYAVDFTNNSHGLVYPNDMNSLICTLVDILRRLHYQLYFICQQCLYSTELGGWRDCWYGREIGGSNWRCNTIQCANQDAGQKHNQRCDQKCNQIADCGLKSPLQSFLEDGLPGFLPHLVTSKGPKMSCGTCARASPGMPCLTPMGFSDISNLASHRRKGQQLYMALTGFCSSVNSPLTKLCCQLNSILPSAPKTLDDMFGFYYNLLKGWNNSNQNREQQRENAFNDAVCAANFGNGATTLDINPIFRGHVHSSGGNMQHMKGDLNSLVNCDFNDTSNPAHPCGPYLRPICRDMCNTFTKDNADKYVSWVVYCTGSFLELLEQLYAECCANCDSKTAKCRTSKCDAICVSDNSPMAPDYTHKENCSSIVHCRFMRPTLYKYGLVHNNIKALAGVSSKRTCKDFCNALEKVINKEVKFERALPVLVYRTIPQFLWDIRQKFFWLNVALWSLSLFYLICVMVGRLDVLHIRSHLRIPSSHKITAQSLLAAAQVGRLAKISYLQP